MSTGNTRFLSLSLSLSCVMVSLLTHTHTPYTASTTHTHTTTPCTQARYRGGFVSSLISFSPSLLLSTSSSLRLFAYVQHDRLVALLADLLKVLVEPLLGRLVVVRIDDKTRVGADLLRVLGQGDGLDGVVRSCARVRIVYFFMLCACV